jgi:hypothetical protein
MKMPLDLVVGILLIAMTLIASLPPARGEARRPNASAAPKPDRETPVDARQSQGYGGDRG